MTNQPSPTATEAADKGAYGALLTKDEAAAYLSITPRQVMKLARTRVYRPATASAGFLLRSVQVFGTFRDERRFRLSDLDDFVTAVTTD